MKNRHFSPHKIWEEIDIVGERRERERERERIKDWN